MTANRLRISLVLIAVLGLAIAAPLAASISPLTIFVLFVAAGLALFAFLEPVR